MSTCKKCNGQMIESTALMNDSAVMGIPDFDGNMAHSSGQTITFKSSGRRHDCLKCSDCGWSVTGSSVHQDSDYDKSSTDGVLLGL